MVRAIIFDFFSVWAPDTLGMLLDQAKATLDPEQSEELVEMVDHYYHGGVGASSITSRFKWVMQRDDIETGALILQESELVPDVVRDIRILHAHFFKVGVLGNMGINDLEFLNRFNSRENLFETITCPITMGTNQPTLSKEVFGQAFQQLGEPPDACMAVSGNDGYLAFAKSLGMEAVKFEDMTKFMELIAEMLSKDTPNLVNPV